MCAHPRIPISRASLRVDIAPGSPRMAAGASLSICDTLLGDSALDNEAALCHVATENSKAKLSARGCLPMRGAVGQLMKVD
jgi:hypothetical protein